MSFLLECVLPKSNELASCPLLLRVPILLEAQRFPQGTFTLWLFLAGDSYTLCSLSNLSFFLEDLGVPRKQGFLRENKGTDLGGL